MRFRTDLKGLAICCLGLATLCLQIKSPKRLCNLQEIATQGSHIIVTVSGVYSTGPESSTLTDPACPVKAYGQTWVEFDLKSNENEQKLKELLTRSQEVNLTAEGDFYGPPPPDPKLPSPMREKISQRWGHLGCCRTRFVVRKILDVRANSKS